MNTLAIVISLLALCLSAWAARYSYQVKRLDLRVELRKASSDLSAAVASLPSLLERANKSYSRNAAAAGMFASGAFQEWSRQYKDDESGVALLAGELAALERDFRELKLRELEEQLVVIHGRKRRAEELRVQYESSMARDARQVEQRMSKHHPAP